MSIEIVFDCTAANLPTVAAIAAKQGIRLAGYVTGSGGVPWTAADFAAHPGSVRIDQTPAGTAWDATADVDDYESGAVQLSELAARARERMASYAANRRPGQRHPAIYASEGNLTPVANALVKGGVTSGVGLWVADWSWSSETSILELARAGGPFPVVGVQLANAGAYDVSFFSTQWLDNVSGAVSVTKPPQSIVKSVSVTADGKPVFTDRFTTLEVTVS